MVNPKFLFLLVVLSLLLMATGCGSGGNGGSSQGFYGQVVDCSIGGTSGTPPDGTQFASYSFTISGIPSGQDDGRTENFLVYQEDVMPPGLRLDPAGNSDGTSDIEVIGSPWAAGFQTLRVLVADDDNESCYTTFEFTILVSECDMGLSPFDDENPLPEDLASGTVGEPLTTSIDRTVNIGTSDQITVFFLTEFFDEDGDPFDPFTEFPVPGLTVTIDDVTTGLAPIDISGVPSLVGTYIFTVRISASAVNEDPTLDPLACVVEETYAIVVTTTT